MFDHMTVLKEEAIDGLHIKPNGIYMDCTLGGAGHSELISQHLNQDGILICVDQDEKALIHAQKRLAHTHHKTHFIHNNFRHIDRILDQLHIPEADGFLYDLGVSSPQLDERERGFSYQQDAFLDMRMNKEQELTAYEVINEWDEKQLADVIYQYGEERFSRRIAAKIVEKRRDVPIKSTFDLVDIIKQSIPAKARRKGPHPAKRTFQAIRIAVNDELLALNDSLHQALERLSIQGRISVITFHSLEDRICKNFFQDQSKGCVCPPGFPQCVCGQVPKLKVKNKKPILPKREEIEQNPRARSAKLRIAEKI